MCENWFKLNYVCQVTSELRLLREKLLKQTCTLNWKERREPLFCVHQLTFRKITETPRTLRVLFRAERHDLSGHAPLLAEGNAAVNSSARRGHMGTARYCEGKLILSLKRPGRLP